MHTASIIDVRSRVNVILRITCEVVVLIVSRRHYSGGRPAWSVAVGWFLVSWRRRLLIIGGGWCWWLVIFVTRLLRIVSGWRPVGFVLIAWGWRSWFW